MSNLLKDNNNLMKEYNYSKNKNIDVNSLTLGSEKKIWWTCSKGHEYESKIVNRNNGRGCPYCANKKVLIGYNDLASMNPKLAKEWNYEKNGNLTPYNTMSSSNKKVWWICPKGHEYQASVNNRKNGTNCPYCSNKKVLIGYNDLSTTNPELSMEWNYKKNGDLTPSDVVNGSNKKVWWICPKGHEYESKIIDRKNGDGCPYCSNHQILIGYNDLSTTNSGIAKEWDYKRNGDLTPDQFTSGSSKKIWWICPKGHEYQATISHRTHGTRCPICMKESSISLSEKIVLFYIKKYFENNDVLENYSPKNFGKSNLDIYIRKLKIGIEYDGAQFHRDIKRDLKKDTMCLNNGITLYRIREPKCPRYDSNSIKIYLNKINSIELEISIKKLLNILGVNNPIVNTEDDLQDIYSMIDFYEKEQSLLSINPILSKEWDYEKMCIYTKICNG